jgi:hypothetical protein
MIKEKYALWRRIVHHCILTVRFIVCNRLFQPCVKTYSILVIMSYN